MPRLTFETSVLAALWVVSVAAMASGWLLAQSAFVMAGTIASLGFVLTLMVVLWQQTPTPAIASATEHSLPFIAMLGIVLAAIGLVFTVSIIAHPWIILSAVLGLIAVGVIVIDRQQVTPVMAASGIAAGAICLGLGVATGRPTSSQFIYMLVVPLTFGGGALLVARTGLTPVYSAQGDWRAAAKGFALGAVLALPSALMNLGSGVQANDRINAVWEPLTALVPGIAEESIARLMLLSLVFFVLRARPGASTRTALGAALLISAFTHAFAHLPVTELVSPAGGMMVLAGFLFGLPMGLVFLRFGFEAAVGYHFFVDFVRFAAAYAMN